MPDGELTPARIREMERFMGAAYCQECGKFVEEHNWRGHQFRHRRTEEMKVAGGPQAFIDQWFAKKAK